MPNRPTRWPPPGSRAAVALRAVLWPALCWGIVYPGETPSSILIATFASMGGDLSEAPIHTNWMDLDGYREMVLWLKEHLEPGAEIEVEGEVGTVAFFSQHPMREWLLDRGWLVEFADLARKRGARLQLQVPAAASRAAPARYLLIGTDEPYEQRPGRLITSWEGVTRSLLRPRCFLLFRR